MAGGRWGHPKETSTRRSCKTALIGSSSYFTAQGIGFSLSKAPPSSPTPQDSKPPSDFAYVAGLIKKKVEVKVEELSQPVGEDSWPASTCFPSPFPVLRAQCCPRRHKLLLELWWCVWALCVVAVQSELQYWYNASTLSVFRQHKHLPREKL